MKHEIEIRRNTVLKCLTFFKLKLEKRIMLYLKENGKHENYTLGKCDITSNLKIQVIIIHYHSYFLKYN